MKDEDPKTYVSQKTGRGPLMESWLEEYWSDVKVQIPFSPYLLFRPIARKVIDIDALKLLRENNNRRHPENR